MGKPIIAVTAGKQNPPPLPSQRQTVLAACSMHYVNALVRAGGAPVLLPCGSDRAAIDAILRVADGVLLTGGGDIVSLVYGEEPHPQSKFQDPERDEMEFEVVRLAVERGLPILGVCRGIQVLNVALGGTLVQDVPSQVPNAVRHNAEALDTVLLHTVELEPDSLLARLFGTTSMAVNSFHHQAVKEVGSGLRINCRARDGVIEGIESVERKPVLGVQFHPEECAGAYPQFQNLFDWLVNEAG